MASLESTSSGVQPYVPPRAPAGSGTARDTTLERVTTLARVLDRYFVDPILGLVMPGVGDVLGALLGTYTVMVAVRRKVSPVVIARMLMNLATDAVIGLIPLLGDVFDIGFKANQRNARLLAERVEHGGRATRRDWLIVIGAGVAYVAVLGLVIYGIVAVLRAVL